MNHHIYILSLFYVLLSCGQKDNPVEATDTAALVTDLVTLTEVQLQSAKVELGKLEQKSISTVLKVNGAVDVPPQSMVSISAPLGGYLKSTKLLPGMYLKKGEVIATMEDQQFVQLQEDYLVTKSNLAYTEAEFLRQKELNMSKSSSDKIFQQARMEYDNQRIKLHALAQKLQLVNINPQQLNEQNISWSVQVLSPINGFVSAINVNIGRYVNPSDVLFELINPADIHLNLRIFEKDIAKIFLGQKVLAHTINEPGKIYPCEVMLIGQALSADRTAEVHCHFEHYDKSLLPGMYMNAEIEIKSHNAYVIPEDAVVSFEGKNYLFVSVGKNSFQFTPVETGVIEGGNIEILGADQWQDKVVVTRGAYTLLMEMKNRSED